MFLTLVLGRASARVILHAVDARGSVTAAVALAVVDVRLAVDALETCSERNNYLKLGKSHETFLQPRKITRNEKFNDWLRCGNVAFAVVDVRLAVDALETCSR